MTRETTTSAGSTRLPRRTSNGAELLAALQTATEWLAMHRAAVNDLNVFPVPDGDTGTNMLLTLRAAVTAGTEAAHRQPHAGAMAMAIADGALVGARGNSGVILCQMVRGFALAIADRETIAGSELAAALANARDYAYAAVLEPVEGTMLTVLSAAATAAAAVSVDPDGIPDATAVLDGALTGARQALAETPDLLEVLRAANVVDAGGQGVVYILEGLVRYAAGHTTAPFPADTPLAASNDAPARSAAREAAAHGDAVTGYCVNFLIWTTAALDLASMRAELGALGTSVDLIAADHAVRIHLHTERPGAALEYGASLGELDRIEIDNMARQIEQARHTAVPVRAPAPAPAPAPDPAASAALVTPGEVGVLAVAPSVGLAAALRAMGATRVISDHAAVKPSLADLLAGLAAIPTDQIIILPNDPDVHMAAMQAAKMIDKAVQVVPSRSVPQGLAALSALAPDRSLADNVRRLSAAMALPRTIEVTHASRDATIDAIAIRTGAVIAFVDTTLVATGDALVPVTMSALEKAGLDEAELVTMFTGAELDDVTAEALRAAIVAKAPLVSVEIVAGGQPHYPILVGLE